uniref:Uncharacterized protein LOC104236248 n=1 Tax=Nicotiana sylvestris TaxID=4096 RepID=A0A1U7XNB8_NICSY|nr:PREDICTED: uncharacterized protein LOC104236248 [Nicotiana sylvestris]
MDDWVYLFVMGLEPHLLNDCMLVSLQLGMDIFRIQAYAQGVEDCSTLSYVTPLVSSKFGIESELIKPFEVSTPVGDPVIARQLEKSELAHEIHQLGSLGVRLLDSGDTRVTIQDRETSSFVTEVKERQHEDPVVAHYRDISPQKEKTPFEITGVESSNIEVYYVFLIHVMGETHYSRYFVHPGATKMYHDIREIYWWDEMKKDITDFGSQCPNY